MRNTSLIYMSTRDLLFSVSILFSIILSFSSLYAAGITPSQSSFNPLITESSLSSGAGSNFISPLPLASFEISIAHQGLGNNWSVYVSKPLSLLPAEITIRRTSDGIMQGGNSSILGGTTTIPVGVSETLFFTGSGSIDNIGIECHAVGLSLVSAFPNTYNSVIRFRLARRRPNRRLNE